jgi:hypothetical protein
MFLRFRVSKSSQPVTFNQINELSPTSRCHSCACTALQIHDQAYLGAIQEINSASLNQAYKGQWRLYKMIGLDVYNQNNEKVGDISELLVD